MSEDIRHIEFLATKSKEFIEKQISSYQQKKAHSGSIMAIISLFIPFFLNGLDEALFYVKIACIVPLGLFVYSIYALMQVIRSRALDQGFHTNKFQELVNKNDYKAVLLYEIGANRGSFDDNACQIRAADRNFVRGIKLTFVGVFCSMILLLADKFFIVPKPDPQPVKVQIVK